MHDTASNYRKQHPCLLAWRREGDGAVVFYDLRYGEGSFASIVARPGAACAYPVPPWEGPRSDVLGAAP